MNNNELPADNAAVDTLEDVEVDGSESDVSISSLYTCQMVYLILILSRRIPTKFLC